MPYIALITGASSGLGEATARRLAREPGVRLVLVARRKARLDALANELGGGDSLVLAEDLTDPAAAERIAQAIERECGALHLLVNNAGAGGRRSGFADGGWAEIDQCMRINFEAPVRLIEALLPLLRRTAASPPPPAGPRGLKQPVSIVNVASTAGRVNRPRVGAYSASKFAIAGWTDALHLEERPNGIHVGLVLPGFIPTEGFPQTPLVRHPLGRHILGTPEQAAEAILDAGPGGHAERYVPRYYWLAAMARIVFPAFVRRVLS